MRRIGVLAIQGAFREHCKTLEKLNTEAVEVRSAKDLDSIQGLIIPGGESTAIGKQLEIDGFGERIRTMAKAGFPVFGTCAGMILLSKHIDQSNQYSLELMDTWVKRNAFGRQIASFEADIEIKGIEGNEFRAVFIRAPFVLEAGSEVEILSKIDDKIVFTRQKNLLASAFHPELTDDTRVHQFFLEMVDKFDQ